MKTLKVQLLFFLKFFEKCKKGASDLKFTEMPIGRAQWAFNMTRAVARRTSGLIYHVWVKGRVFLVMIFA